MGGLNVGGGIEDCDFLVRCLVRREDVMLE